MDETLKEQMIEHLNSHPDFLLKNKELLSELLLPHPVVDRSTGNVVSLVEVQTRIQRDEIHDLKDILKVQTTDSKHLHESLQSIRENLACFLEPQPLAETCEIFYRILKYNFSATVIKCVLFMQSPFPAVLETSGLLVADKNDKRKKFLLEVFHRGKPLCGVLQEEIMTLLFGEDSYALSSTVLYPIRVEQDDALIALASCERDRYGLGSELELMCLLCDLFARTIENNLARDPGERLIESNC